ncbi:MAG: malto-oligosyltrehalose synthase [Ilumatobacteraceae bacterium]
MLEIPLVATYRLQLTPEFGLADAARIVPYLASLGISHVYTSSYLQAASGSTHGYDVVDPTSVNIELGGEDALLAFHEALEHYDLGNIVDVVPNHMHVGGSQNRLWWDVLKCGRHSAAARYFDIDWDPPEAKLAGKVLLAVLGGSYSEELSAGAFTIAREECGPVVRYYDHRFPIDPDSLGADEADSLERFDDHDLLHDLLERQHYRLASWTVGRDELNYRRFFEVNTLAGVRVEDPVVFDATHQRTLEWVAQGHVQGLRIDHPDGLRDPSGYLDRLRHSAPETWIVVEKILEPGEDLPGDWLVDGTTGYDFMQELTALFVDPAAESAMTTLYTEFSGESDDYPQALEGGKRIALQQLLATEVTRLTNIAAGIFERSVIGRDASRRALRAALEAVLVEIPVYRTYVVDGHPSATDRTIITESINRARLAEPTIAPTVFDALQAIWSGEIEDDDAFEFVARLQQLSGPAMAKGAEDTAFYRYNRLLALNEVGSDPGRFGSDAETFHAAMAVAAERHPRSMIGTSTHDTKRSEDVRIRIALLAGQTASWRSAVLRWRDMNAAKWGDSAPDRNLEYLVYQTLVGAHPLPIDRTLAFLTKAMREAKVHTTWLYPDESYEASVEAFVRALDADALFRDDLRSFVATLTVPGRIAALAQTLIKATSPGIPDFYQGSELWTTSLVDPDNRTPVDYDRRQRLIAASDSPALAADEIGATKQQLIQTALTVRREHPSAFVGENASYAPSALVGAGRDAGVAFQRGDTVITVATIRPDAIGRDGWADTTLTLPNGSWSNRLQPNQPSWSGDVSVGDVVGANGVALLVRTEASRASDEGTRQ